MISRGYQRHLVTDISSLETFPHFQLFFNSLLNNLPLSFNDHLIKWLSINWGNVNKRDHTDRYQFLSLLPHLVSVSVSSYQGTKSVIVIALTFYLMIIIFIIITPSLCWLNATLWVLLISRCMSSRSVRQSLICLSFSLSVSHWFWVARFIAHFPPQRTTTATIQRRRSWGGPPLDPRRVEVQLVATVRRVRIVSHQCLSLLLLWPSPGLIIFWNRLCERLDAEYSVSW